MKKVLWLAVVFASIAAFADDADQLAKAANDAFTAQQWDTAAGLYKKLTQSDPKNVAYWLRLSNTLRHAGDLQGAESALKTASDGGAANSMALQYGLNAAALHAQAGKRDEALADVEDLAKKGIPVASLIEKEPAFASLSKEPRFTKALDEMKAQATPCKSAKNPEYRQFDFWLGDWDVYGKGGALVGKSHENLILGDCVLNENWTDQLGNEGKSYNKYNAGLKRWEQYWVDQYGATTHFIGNLEGPNMVFYADDVDQAGKAIKRRLTFFNLGPDKVRQFGESTEDGGKTWITNYDLTYVRRK